MGLSCWIISIYICYYCVIQLYTYISIQVLYYLSIVFLHIRYSIFRNGPFFRLLIITRITVVAVFLSFIEHSYYLFLISWQCASDLRSFLPISLMSVSAKSYLYIRYFFKSWWQRIFYVSMLTITTFFYCFHSFLRSFCIGIGWCCSFVFIFYPRLQYQNLQCKYCSLLQSIF